MLHYRKGLIDEANDFSPTCRSFGPSLCAADGQCSVSRQEILGLLKCVQVLLEELDAQTVSEGLTREQLRTDAELRLRKAGIRIAAEKDYSSNVGVLYIRVGTNGISTASKVQQCRAASTLTSTSV